MQIDTNQLPGLAASYLTKNEGPTAPTAFGRRPAAAPAAQDTVTTSSRQNLVELAQALEDPARAARIQALTAQVQAGDYQVDASALAGRLASQLFDR